MCLLRSPWCCTCGLHGACYDGYAVNIQQIERAQQCRLITVKLMPVICCQALRQCNDPKPGHKLSQPSSSPSALSAEPVSVVEPTVIAALNMTWPGSRLAVHVLDDGGRAEVAEMVQKNKFQLM